MSTETTQAEVILNLINKVEDKNQRIKELENKIRKFEDQTKNSQNSNNEQQDQEKEEEDEAFFKTMKPKAVGFKERKNAIAEWFKNQGRTTTASIPVISEQVFGYRTANSTSSQYSAMRNAIQEDPRIQSTNSKDGRFKEYTLNNKVKIE